ncbi:hypothetical protein BDY24DRAFT_415061 [Mrakia frigida]|uniref:uncharacterized protein n=1 Tax=Mrakia frigida TaxID=29902 RepID=UPI003FCC1C83
MSSSAPSLPSLPTIASLRDKLSLPFFYPLDPDRSQTTKRAVAAGALYGFGQGTVLGIWMDTAIGVHGVTNAINMAIWTGVFFVGRETFVSPLLLQLGLTEDHRRRYQLAKLASPKWHRDDDPPLAPERWSHIRYRRLIDTGLTGGVLGLAAPHFHRWLLHSQGYDALIRLSPKTKAFTFFTSSLATALLQLAYNSYLIHDLKLHEAYDSLGPIPNVDITRVRAQERDDLNRVALYATVMQQAEAKRKKEEALKEHQLNPFGYGSKFQFGTPEPGGVTGSAAPGGVEEGFEWWTWNRFRRDALPSFTMVSLEERIEKEKGKREMLKSLLEEVRVELEDLGEVMDLVLGEELSDPLMAVKLNERPEEAVDPEEDMSTIGFTAKFFGGFKKVV